VGCTIWSKLLPIKLSTSLAPTDLSQAISIAYTYRSIEKNTVKMSLPRSTRQASRLIRQLNRSASSRTSTTRIPNYTFSLSRLSPVFNQSFHTSSRRYAGLMPDTSNPAPRKAEEHDQTLAPAELTEEEFHHLADQYLEKLITKLQEKQDAEGLIDAELSVSFTICRCVDQNTDPNSCRLEY
jgi:hypothetical protein